MIFVIIRAQCKLSNGATKVFLYNTDNATKQNACNDIEAFRTNLKNTIEHRLGVTVSHILLTYEERDSRK